MKKFQVLALFLFIICFCGGCASGVQNVDEDIRRNDEPEPYLVITESYYEDDSESSMSSRCFVYDMKSKAVQEKASVPYTSVYPLTMYSDNTNSVFYTAYSDKGDQIYLYGNGKNDDKKTSEFSAINYMIQCGDKYFVAAKMLDCYCIEPFVFDSSFGNLDRVFYDENDDRFTWRVSTIPQDDAVLFSYYSEKEDDEKLDNSDYESAASDIAMLDMETKDVRIIYQTNQYVWGLAGNGEKLYLATAPGGTSDKKFNKCYEIDLETNQSMELDIPICVTGDMALWENTLYCLGFVDDVRGIYAYNLLNKDVELILKQKDDEFINGFAMNY